MNRMFERIGLIPAGREDIRVDADMPASGWVERGPRVVLYRTIPETDDKGRPTGRVNIGKTQPLPADPILLNKYLDKGFSLTPPRVEETEVTKVEKDVSQPSAHASNVEDRMARLEAMFGELLAELRTSKTTGG